MDSIQIQTRKADVLVMLSIDDAYNKSTYFQNKNT